MKDKIEFDVLMKNRPSILGNSIGMLLIRILASILAVLCFAAGIYFLTLSIINESKKSFIEALYWGDTQPLSAAFCLLLSIFLFFIARMARMLLVRNDFILELKEWSEKGKKEITKE